MDTEHMLGMLRQLVDKLGRFPTKGDIKVAKSTEPRIPSYEAFFRLSGGSYPHLRTMLLEHCQARCISPEIELLLKDADERTSFGAVAKESATTRVRGYVYLVKHGGDYKIGRSNNVARRRREFALLLPQELEHVHVIETDDPEGIERYWHRRFEERKARGEWFRLTPQDVAAFRRRRYQ